jgi:hypothetical protein
MFLQNAGWLSVYGAADAEENIQATGEGIMVNGLLSAATLWQLTTFLLLTQ